MNTPPIQLGRYKLVERIGIGGMAEVYRAFFEGPHGFKREVAIKIILPQFAENAEFKKMFIDEAKALMRITHSNIVHVFELGEEGKRLFIAMEYIKGTDLGRLLAARGRLELSLSCFIIHEALKALAFAHAMISEDGNNMHMVHRDVSPCNIIIGRDGTIKLTDFGISKGAHKSSCTQIDQLKGKIMYMSPEQANMRTTDHRCDIFSAGLILYEMVSGNKYFSAECELELLDIVRSEKFVDDWEEHVPPPIRKILRRSLEPDPDKRYQNADEFIDDLELLMQCHNITPPLKEIGALVDESIFMEQHEMQQPAETAILSSPQPTLERKNRAPILSLILAASIFILFTPDHRNTSGNIAIDTASKYYDVITSINNFHPTDEETGNSKPVTGVPQTEQSPQIIDHISANGFISVDARPWGFVSIGNLLKDRETPINRFKLPTGIYNIIVRNNDQKVSKKVEIKEDSVVHCRARLDDKTFIKCDRPVKRDE